AAAISLALVVAFSVAYFRSTNRCNGPKPASLRDPMKQVVYCDYGEADVLKLEDVEKPVPGDDELLIKVRASSVNPLDWHFMRGTPYAARFMMGLRKPEDVRLGVDFAGTVERVGTNVTQFKAGDDVFGAADGAFGEYVT